jgi:acyl carrier protein
MTKTQFVEALAAVLEVDPTMVKPSAKLLSFRLWDSTAGINMLVVFDEHDIAVEEDRIRDCKTVQDLMDLAGCRRAQGERAQVQPVQEDCQ